jgi:hypothetical protein
MRCARRLRTAPRGLDSAGWESGAPAAGENGQEDEHQPTSYADRSVVGSVGVCGVPAERQQQVPQITPNSPHIPS